MFQGPNTIFIPSRYVDEPVDARKVKLAEDDMFQEGVAGWRYLQLFAAFFEI